MKGFIESLWRSEPTLVLTALASIIVFGAAKAGVIIPEQTVLQALAYVVPIILAGVGIRTQVTPAR